MIGCARFYRRKTRLDSNVFSNRVPSISSDFSDTCLLRHLGFQTHKGDVKCAFLQGDLDEQRVDDDDDDDNFKIESAQPVSDTFCEPIPELSRKLQLEHPQCIRLLTPVYGLVNAPRRWYHRVTTDLRNLTSEESVVEPVTYTDA